MAYTTINKPTDYFNTVTYSGTGSSQSITGVGFQPDFVWCKARSGTWGSYNHNLFDVIRGVTKRITSNDTLAEATVATSLTAFNADGWTGGGDNETNNSGTEYVSWNWLGANGTSSNTAGSINSTVSANTTSGFSVVSWTGTNANATVGHGLSSAPTIIFFKVLGEAGSWAFYSKGLGANKYLSLNTTTAETIDTGMFQNTDPTSSIFSVGANLANKSFPMIAYCFADVQGYSKFGSYTGNGNADGTFVYTGFKPAFVMSKRSDAIDGWRMMDTTRSSYNVAQHRLLADAYGAEVVGTAQGKDFLSNGFKIRNTDSGYNASGGTYIYMAFAEAPLVGSNNIPCTAR